MDGKILEQVLEYLKNTGEALAKSGFRIAYVQALNTGVMQLIFAFLLIIASSILFYRLWKGMRKLPADDNYKLDQGDVMWLFLFFIIPYFISGMMIYFGSLMVLNPAWYAVQMIIDTIK